MESNATNVLQDSKPAQTKPLFDKTIFILLLAAVIGLIVFVTKESSAFPNASLDLKTPRAEITAICDKWAAQLGYNKTGKIESTTFTYDNEAKTFLEYELGLTKANELMRSDIPIWGWFTRMCKQFEQEEMYVTVSPEGKLTDFRHAIENDKALPTISQDDARAMAQKFIEQQAMLSLANYKLIKDEAVSNPHRTDYSFTWEDQSQEFKGARRRIDAAVSGNILTGFDYYLHVPEEWSRKFSTIRSYNQLLASVASVFYILLHIAAVAILLWGITKRKIRWRFTLIGGGTLALLQMLESFNNFASVVSAYDTRTSFQAYVTQFCVSTAADAVRVLLLGIVVFGAAELIYRMSYPDKVALENAFSGAGTKSKQVLRGLVVGHSQLLVDLGWVVGYYLIGSLFHFWCPLGVENYQVLSTTAPFLSAINLGFRASTTEEFIYRVIGLSLARKVFRNFWLANFFQAAAWAFMHSTYPQQPCYARGVELTISGMFSGWILKRYGLVPCLVSHYLLDAFFTCKPLFNSTEPYLRLSALIPIVPFVIMACVAAWRLKHAPAQTEEVLLNSAIVEAKRDDEEPVIVEHEPFEYQPLSYVKRAWLGGVIAVAAVAMLFFHTSRALDNKQVSINRQQATSIGMTKLKDYLSERKESAQGRMHVAWLTTTPTGDDLQYIFEKAGLKRAMELANITSSGYLWEIRSFKPLDAEEYRYSLDGSGKQVSFDVTKAEDAPGANLTKDVALKLATDYINQSHPEYVPFTFDNSAETVRKARTDYTLTFKVPKYKVDEADCKIVVSVIGDEVSGFGQYFDIPDQWRWERSKRTLKDDIADIAQKLFSLGAVLAVLWWTFGVLRTGVVRWRPAIILAIPFALMALPVELNSLPEYFRFYSNTQPIPSYVINQLMDLVRNMMTDFFSLLLLVAFGLAAFRLLYPRTHIAGIVQTIFGRADKNDHRNYWFDGILIGYAYIAVGGLIHIAEAFLSSKISPTVPQAVLYPVCSLANVMAPALDFLVEGLKAGTKNVFLIPIVVGLYAKYCKNPKWIIPWVLGSALILNSYERYWQDYAIGVASFLLTAAVSYFFITRLAKRNVLAYFIAGAYPALVDRLAIISRHGFQLMIVDVAEIVLIIAIPLIYIAVLYLSKDRSPSVTVPTEAAQA